jgi:hypothetical protein
MSYLQVNLANVSSRVRDALKEFAWVDVDPEAGVIIIDATDKDVLEKLQRLQEETASEDVLLEFPSEMKIVPRDAVINGSPIRHQFYDKLAATNDPDRFNHLDDGDAYEGGIWYIKVM